MEVALKSSELDIFMLEKQLELENLKRINELKKYQIISQLVSKMILAGYDTEKLSKERDNDEIVEFVTRVV